MNSTGSRDNNTPTVSPLKGELKKLTKKETRYIKYRVSFFENNISSPFRALGGEIGVTLLPPSLL
jgi:hypothetical protein